MSGQALSDTQHREVRQISELQVRQYFDRYLNEVWPKQQEELEKHCRNRVEYHNTDPKAHGGTEKRVNRFVWTMIGVSLSSGAGGAGLLRMLMVLGG